MATVLHVEDEPAIGSMLEDILERVRHSLVGTANATALEAVTHGLALLRHENDALRREVSRLRDESPMRGSKPGEPPAVELPAKGIVLNTLNLDEAETVLIARALEVTGGNRTRAAGLLGFSVRTLRNKLNGRAP
jgi:DNA-binding NtrC family response regulator